MAGRSPASAGFLFGACVSAFLLAVVGGTSGCAGPGARTALLNRGVISGVDFPHRLYFKGEPEAGRPVRVYLGGDGQAWLGPRRPARDPTPRRDLALALMARDPAPAVYLARPCYHGLAMQPPCGPWWWTHGRYGPQVVASMAGALARLREARKLGPMTLVGYSGGGVLAVLLAPRVPGVEAVVTVAANLDTAAWARHHGYSALTGSLNPATQPPLPRRVRQLHLFGGRDAQAPRELAARFLGRQPAAAVRVAPEADHGCCWEQLWVDLLRERLDGPPGPDGHERTAHPERVQVPRPVTRPASAGAKGGL